METCMFYSQSMNSISSFKYTSWRDPTKKDKNVEDYHSMNRNIRVVPPSTDYWGYHEEPSWDSEEEPEIFGEIAERLASDVAVDRREESGPIRHCRNRARLSIIEPKQLKSRRNLPYARKSNGSNIRCNKS